MALVEVPPKKRKSNRVYVTMSYLGVFGFLLLVDWASGNSFRELWETFPVGVWIIFGLFIFFCYCMTIAILNAPTEAE